MIYEIDGVAYRAGKRLWTPADEDRLRALYPHQPTAAVAAALGRSCPSTYNRARQLGLTKSDAFWASPASGRTNGRQGIGTRFVKGQAPANKGLRRPGWGPGRMKETQFRPGTRQGAAAENWRPIGTTAVDAEGYWRIKVREAAPGEPHGFGNTQAWPLLHRHRWAEAHGPIPPGHAVVFRDGDRTNCALENLELVSRQELMRRNSVHRLPAPLVQTIQLLGAVKRQIRRRERHATHDR